MLCWNVYCSDFNSREIEVYNIFQHYSFYDACVKAKKKFKEDKQGFADDVKSWLMYFFWSKCEWEILLEHWPDGEWSELRQNMTIGDLRKMLYAAGKDTSNWHLTKNSINTDVTLKIYPDWRKCNRTKIDVYDQVVNNWDIFIDYLWNNRKELKERK